MEDQTGRAVDLAEGVLQDGALVRGVLEAVCQEAGVPLHWGQGDLDRGVKVDRDLGGEVPGSQEAGVPCFREGEVSCDRAEEVHRGRLGGVGRHQGEDSTCSEAAEGSPYYVVEGVLLVRAEG